MGEPIALFIGTVPNKLPETSSTEKLDVPLRVVLGILPCNGHGSFGCCLELDGFEGAPVVTFSGRNFSTECEPSG
jgi:hypothetical protein